MYVYLPSEVGSTTGIPVFSRSVLDMMVPLSVASWTNISLWTGGPGSSPRTDPLVQLYLVELAASDYLVTVCASPLLVFVSSVLSIASRSG